MIKRHHNHSFIHYLINLHLNNIEKIKLLYFILIFIINKNNEK